MLLFAICSESLHIFVGLWNLPAACQLTSLYKRRILASEWRPSPPQLDLSRAGDLAARRSKPLHGWNGPWRFITGKLSWVMGLLGGGGCLGTFTIVFACWWELWLLTRIYAWKASRKLLHLVDCALIDSPRAMGHPGPYLSNRWRWARFSNLGLNEGHTCYGQSPVLMGLVTAIVDGRQPSMVKRKTQRGPKATATWTVKEPLLELKCSVRDTDPHAWPLSDIHRYVSINFFGLHTHTV